MKLCQLASSWAVLVLVLLPVLLLMPSQVLLLAALQRHSMDLRRCRGVRFDLARKTAAPGTIGGRAQVN